MKYQTIIYLIIIFLVIPVQIIFSQNNATKVSVNITLSQKTSNVEGTILTGFVEKELRKLNNVEVVDTNGDFKINIMMFENFNKEGDSLGYVLSVILLAFSKCEGYNIYKYLTSTLITAKESEFEKTAENIVVYFKDDIRR